MSAVEGRLKAAAERLRTVRAEHPAAQFVAVDPEVIDALAVWLESDATAAAFITELDSDETVAIAFGEGLALADAVLWDVPR